MNKCLVLLVEGDTELEFYKQVVANIRKLHPMGRFDTNIEYRNVGGVGGFKNIALKNLKKKLCLNMKKIASLRLCYAVIQMYLIFHKNHQLNGMR